MIIRGKANGSDFVMNFTPTTDGKWKGRLCRVVITSMRRYVPGRRGSLGFARIPIYIMV